MISGIKILSMKWSELPVEYRALENTFDKSDEDLQWKEEDNIARRFVWSRTPQGREFWYSCWLAEPLPEIPEFREKDYEMVGE
jgi:hypothetical protein